VTDFSSLGLAEPILRAVSAEGYTSPTPIQAKVIPAMMQGTDVLGIAQTGTGKTAAFVLPILNALQQHMRPAQPKACRTLILSPTRELAAQIADNIRVYGKHTRPSVAVVVGGARIPAQIKALANGNDIVVATPGRLLDLVKNKAARLDAVETVVLDEADQMFDLGFMPQIKKIMAQLPKKRQTVLLSATMPKTVRDLAQAFLFKPLEVTVTPNSKPIDRIDQKVLMVPAGSKRDVLVDYLARDGVERAVVFTRTKRGADKVCKHLDMFGFAAAAIHGNKSQNQRTRSLNGFRSGKVSILVATDIAARGIDVDGVSHVVNYELPNVAEAYVHRVGRTARAGRSGEALTLCDNTERGLLRDIERLIKRKIDVAETPEASGRTVVAPEERASYEVPEEKPRPTSRKPRRRKPQGNGQKQDGGQNAGRPARGNKARSGKPQGGGQGRGQGGAQRDAKPGNGQRRQKRNRRPAAAA
jgi:ATP-dependent RNA helicase RhlE